MCVKVVSEVRWSLLLLSIDVSRYDVRTGLAMSSPRSEEFDKGILARNGRLEVVQCELNCTIGFHCSGSEEQERGDGGETNHGCE